MDNTADTRSFVNQFKDPNTSLVVTTIQKLNKAIKGRFKGAMEGLKISEWSLFLMSVIEHNWRKLTRQ